MMRLNKQELLALASQPSQIFDKEGILVIKEKQEGFFRRAESLKAVPFKNRAKDGKRDGLRSLSCVGVSGKVSSERWFRLCGNLLFYLRGPEQWSEPHGVIIVEYCKVRIQTQDNDGLWPFHIVWDSGLCYKLAASMESERASWVDAIEEASYEKIRSKLFALRNTMERKKELVPEIDIETWRLKKRLIVDINEVPLCELSLACDNLLCDSYGRPPSPLILVYVKSYDGSWIRYACTEIVETSSNPTFYRTVSFRSSDGLTGASVVRLLACDVKELVSQTAIPIGSAKFILSTIQDTQRLRQALTTPEKKTVGFLTINCWSLEQSSKMSSPHRANAPISAEMPQKQYFSHRRSHSLPPRLGVKLEMPSYGQMYNNNLVNVHQVTYRFHSGLGGDISVHEVMAESKICFVLPQQLLGIYIQREKELLQELVCMGELGGAWKSRQMELLDTQLSLLKHYSHARQSLQIFQKNNGKYFKESSRKHNASLEFAPVNLHLQRMWVINDTLNKTGFYDIVTVGAFTGHCQRAGKTGGLMSLVQQLKEMESCVPVYQTAIREHMAADTIQAIKRLRGEIVQIMHKLLILAKDKKSDGMLKLADDVIQNSKTLLSICDAGLMEEALGFIDENKVAQPTSTPGASEALVRPHELSSFKQLTHQLRNVDLQSPELEDFLTPSTPPAECYEWMDTMSFTESSSSKSETLAEVSPYHVHPLILSNIDEDATTYSKFEEFRSFHFHTCEDHAESSPIDKPAMEGDVGEYRGMTAIHALAIFGHRNVVETESTQTEATSTLEDSLQFKMSLEENGNQDEPSSYAFFERETGTDAMANQYLDVDKMTNSPSANYYKPSDEPEPWDLTELNIEASVMCLVSMVKFLCGRCGSPAQRLKKPTCKLYPAPERFFEKKPSAAFGKTPMMNTTAASEVSFPKISTQGGVVKQTSVKTNNEADLLTTDDSAQKAVTKGNKFTEGLKLSELTDWPSELRPATRKLRKALDGFLKSGRLAHAVSRLSDQTQHNRRKASLQIRRDVCFTQALTAMTTGLYCWLWTADEEVIWRLLASGLGPLCGFEGLLTVFMAEKAMWGDMVVAIEDMQTVSFTMIKSNYSATAMPQATGTRDSITILMPVPDTLYTHLSSKQLLTFTITAVFFNIGINKKVDMVEAKGNMAQQDQSNCDNYEKLNVYYLKYKKVFPAPASSMATGSRIKPLEEVMENLRMEVQKKTSKNVAVLHLAQTATRMMNGVRITSCKSAKDRTSMSVTLEQCMILSNEYHLADHEFQAALNCMRSDGCRRENTYKNTGVRKYAFNKSQVSALPNQYRPPVGTYGTAQT